MEVFDFFSKEEAGEPFADGIEATYAYLRWYDMFLSYAMDKSANPDFIKKNLLAAAELLVGREKASAGSEVSAEYGIGINRVAAEYGLSGYGFFCLLMAVSQEMDGHYISSFRTVSEIDEESQCPTFSLSENIYSLVAEDEELFDVKRTEGVLRYCPLFDIHASQRGKGSLADGFEANRQLVSLLKGDYLLGKNLSEICMEALATGREKGSKLHAGELDRLTNYLDSSQKPGKEEDIPGRVIQITGKKGSGRKQLILHALPENTPVLMLNMERLINLSDAEAYQRRVSDVLVRTRLLGQELVIICRGDISDNALNLLLLNCLRQLDRVFVVSDTFHNIDEAGLECDSYSINLTAPKAVEQEWLWEKELSNIKTEKGLSASEFSRKYRLLPGTIHDCVKQAKDQAVSQGRKTVTRDDITDAVLSNTTTSLDALTDRIPLKFGWEDLIIEDSQRKIMETLCSRVKNRSFVNEQWGFDEKMAYGKGVSMILYGPPGTGKTMAAQVMAKEIGMALYRVDLSQLVDKYIGETEKNIGRIFDAASDGNVILFFDEADALFSRRTEVQTSNDKHANTEVAYLLQKIEQHDGVTFLATNRLSDFDTAFLRRLTYAVKLGKPQVEERLALFESILPDKTPRSKELDLKFFAENFELSGSEIKEVLYSAAFIAAMEESELCNQHISRAIKYQQEKTGRVLNGSEFGRYL